MSTPAKRLAPTSDTVRQLYLKSGNMCAFPGCTALMMNAEGAFIGQLCHVESAEQGGERFNVSMTNEERRAPENLMLMCYEHHVVTNDVGKYPVDALRKFKADHESRFSSPDRAILATLKDWTTTEDPRAPKNLRRVNRVLGWNQSTDELADTAGIIGEYLETLRRVPMEVRSFLGKVAERAHRLGNVPATGNSSRDGILVACFDLENAFKMNAEALNRQATQLNLYGLGRIEDLDLGEREVPAILIKGLDGWPIWKDLAKFCSTANVSMETFSELLDFSPLDE